MSTRTDAPRTVSAQDTPEFVPSALVRLPRAAIPLPFRLPHPPSLTRLAIQLRKGAEAMRRIEDTRRMHAEAAILVARCQAVAESADWGARELARRTGIPTGTWWRLKSGTANLRTWLPPLRAAAARLREP